MVDFRLSDEQEALRASVRDFAREQIAPVIAKYYDTHTFPYDLVRPLADAISTNIADRARDRLTAILISFGPAARLHVERMKASDNAAVRRTALYLLSEFGGQDALPDLKELLNDSSAQIQRFTAKAGTGTARLEGSASLGEAPKASLRLTAERFQVLGRVDRRIVASGSGMRLDNHRISGLR